MTRGLRAARPLTVSASACQTGAHPVSYGAGPGLRTGEMIRLLLEADPGRKLFGLDLSEENAVSGPGKTAGQGGADSRGQ